MKNKDIVKKYIGDLEHFIVEGFGWPIIVEPHHKRLVKLVPELTIKNGKLQLNPKTKFKPKLLVEFWKYMYYELHSSSDSFDK